MAARGLPRSRLDELRGELRTDGDRERAARDEPASFGRVDRGGGREALLLLDPLHLQPGRRIGRGGEQERCTGAEARRAPGRPGPRSTICPAYMTRMSSAI